MKRKHEMDLRELSESVMSLVGQCAGHRFLQAMEFIHEDMIAPRDKTIADLLEVARMVEAWSHGLRHRTAHESAMVDAARAAIAKATTP